MKSKANGEQNEGRGSAPSGSLQTAREGIVAMTSKNMIMFQSTSRLDRRETCIEAGRHPANLVLFRAAYSADFWESPTPKGRLILFRPLADKAGNERFPVLCHTTPTGLRRVLARIKIKLLFSIASAFLE